MNSIVTKLISIILAILLLAYIGVQVATAVYNPYQTEIVKLKSYSNKIDLEGFFIRDEVALTNQKSGVINYKFEDGEKIPKQSVVADIYNLESDLYNIKRVEKLKQEKKVFQELQNSKNVEGSKLDFLTNQLNQNQIDLVGLVESGNLHDVSKIRESFIYNLNKIDMSVKKNIDFESHIIAIDTEIERVSSLISPSNAPVISEESGYFSSTVDGLESRFTMDMLDELSIAKVKELTKVKPTKSNSIGKLQMDSDWYFVALVDTAYLENIKVGKTVSLTFSAKSTKIIDTVVDRIITEKGNDKSALVLYSNFVDADIMSMRFEKPQALLGSYSGIVIPKEAIRVTTISKTIVNEETKEETTQDVLVKGVYVMLGKSVRFKELDIAYEDMYVVVSKQNAKSNYVSVYDKVIIKGKDLQ